MCGICGFVINKHNHVHAKETIVVMSERLRHRGPDEDGYFIDKDLALGHRRLKIIDLAKGKQPIANEDRTIIIVFNGEIYNYRELRKELVGLGHVFNTDSDTEVIVHLYEEYGKQATTRLNGIFAFTIWDSRRRKLLLVRDRLGVKPLHYSYEGGHFIFASEIKAILAYPFFKKEIDRLSFEKYLVFEFVPAPHSIFSGIKKLPPAHLLEYSLETGNSRLEKYWEPSFSFKNSDIGEREALEGLDAVLKKTVARELVSDVPVGLFLSGGIDSSILAQYASQAGKVESFTISFSESSFDESRYAAAVAGRFGIRHHEETLTSVNASATLNKIAAFLDEPLADASIIPTYLLSRFTKEHVSVALGGDGGDELFAGYDTYQAHRLFKYYAALPSVLKSAAGAIIEKLPVSTRNMSMDFRMKKFISGKDYPPEIRNAIWLGSFSDKELDVLLSGGRQAEGQGNIFEDITKHLAAISGIDDPIERMQYLDMHLYMQDDVLVKVDRASMMHGLEVRVPLLNHELVEYAVSLPSRLKLNGLTTKYLLRRLLAGRLPPSLVNRKKKGFGIPVAEWLKGGLKEMVCDYLCEERLKREGFFNVSQVIALLDEHMNGRKDNRKKLWTILLFELWLDRYGRS